jgi:WhiB family redox-sensing transcriptional regulator
MSTTHLSAASALDAAPPSNADVVDMTALLPVRRDWWDRASCRDPEGSVGGLFFSDELHDIARAKRICADCPVLAPCLEGALERREPWGVWGGQLFLNGRILASKRRRGRPPKSPRPEDQLPEVPIPAHLHIPASA